jgi:hypothetical protein
MVLCEAQYQHYSEGSYVIDNIRNRILFVVKFHLYFAAVTSTLYFYLPTDPDLKKNI